MTVKELIDQLSQLDPALPVYVETPDNVYGLSAEDVEVISFDEDADVAGVTFQGVAL